jgi:hypothetical protein
LIQWRHPIEAIWQMTPRQAYAWLSVGASRRRAERAEFLHLAALAAQGKGEAIERVLRELDG